MVRWSTVKGDAVKYSPRSLPVDSVFAARLVAHVICNPRISSYTVICRHVQGDRRFEYLTQKFQPRRNKVMPVFLFHASHCPQVFFRGLVAAAAVEMTPETAAHQAPPSLGFSRQEHWSGLPFPSPMHESEK